MKQIKQDELIKIRRYFHKRQNGICPVLKMNYHFDEMVVDHAHKSNAKNLGTNEGTLIRGVIHRQANTMEGKITNSFIRCGLHKFDITLPEFLRNLADFIENPPLVHKKYIHPSEAPKVPKLKKNSFKKIQKLYKAEYPNRKSLEYPKSQKLTKLLKDIYETYNIEPEFLKG